MCVEKGDYVFQLSSSLNMMVEKLVPTRFELLKLKQNSWGGTTTSALAKEKDKYMKLSTVVMESCICTILSNSSTHPLNIINSVWDTACFGKPKTQVM